MESYSTKSFTSSQQRVVMRKLQSLSEEHRHHLTSEYDFAGIAQRIDRYLSFERKQRMMVNEPQCLNIYNQLRRGYYEAEFNVFGVQHDPNMNLYGTDYGIHDGNGILNNNKSQPNPSAGDNQAVQKDKMRKTISVSMYLQRNSTLSHQQRTQTQKKAVELLNSNMPKKSRSKGDNASLCPVDEKGQKRKLDVEEEEEIYYDRKMGKCFRATPPGHGDRITSWVATQAKYKQHIPPHTRNI